MLHRQMKTCGLVLIPALTHTFVLFNPPSHRVAESVTSLKVRQLGVENATNDVTSMKGEDENSEATDWGANLGSWSSALFMLREEEGEILREMVNTSHVDEQMNRLSKVKAHDNDSDNARSALVSPPVLQSLGGSNELSPMDRQAATELDRDVTKVTRENALQDIQILPLSPLYNERLSSGHETVFPDMPLSRPEHYETRISSDIRGLAIGIAGSVEEEWQWQTFCEEHGGVRMLLETIQDGAQLFRQKRHRGPRGFAVALSDQNESKFLAACSACRVIRDLMAISDDMRLVLTDEILRANIESGENSLMRDLTLLLKHADDATSLYRRLHKKSRTNLNTFGTNERKSRRESRQRCKLHVLQVLLAMAIASDDAIDALRETLGLQDAVLATSSYAIRHKTRRWLRYPRELWRSSRFRQQNTEYESQRRAFVEAASVRDDLAGQVQGTANQVLAAMGYNRWIPKIPGQKGLRILCFDGGGTRGMSAVATLRRLVESSGGIEACDAFDIICGTSTGAIIAFLVGLRRETSKQANERYNTLIKRIFGKTVMPLTKLFTAASYSEAPFVEVMSEILGESIMLDSRANPTVPFVFGVSSVMNKDPTHVALFRNYNYAHTAMPDFFVDDPDETRSRLGLEAEYKTKVPKPEWRKKFESERFIAGSVLKEKTSRYFGSFRSLQREAMRKSTAATSVFKPVKVKDVIFSDGGIVASNPTSIALHEAQSLFPDVPIELIVSIGTGGCSEKFSRPVIWQALMQMVSSAVDAEQIHHFMEDVFGDAGRPRVKGQRTVSSTRYYRFNPYIGMTNDFPIDGTDPQMLSQLYNLTSSYLEEPEQQRKLREIRDILDGRRGWRKLLPRTNRQKK